MTLDELKAQLATLTRLQATEVVRGVRAMLEALPPSTTSATDARQRAMLEAFVAGYELGANPAKPSGRDPRIPSSEWQRLLMFRDLVGDYEEAMQVIGEPAAVPVAAGTPEAKADLWTRLLKMMLLRKFYAQGDQVQLPKIAKALKACNADNRADVNEWADNITLSWKARDRAELQDFLGALLPESKTSDPFDVLVYGRLIHADADKFFHTQGLDDYERMIVALTGTAELEKSLEYAAYAVRVCMRDELVRNPGTPDAR